MFFYRYCFPGAQQRFEGLWIFQDKRSYFVDTLSVTTEQPKEANKKPAIPPCFYSIQQRLDNKHISLPAVSNAKKRISVLLLLFLKAF